MSSPVFLSKFSHFLLPQVFPVVDQAVMGTPFGFSYRAHFEGVKGEWAGTAMSIREDLQARLFSEMGRP